jgi:hypothetical protein
VFVKVNGSIAHVSYHHANSNQVIIALGKIHQFLVVYVFTTSHLNTHHPNSYSIVYGLSNILVKYHGVVSVSILAYVLSTISQL